MDSATTVHPRRFMRLFFRFLLLLTLAAVIFGLGFIYANVAYAPPRSAAESEGMFLVSKEGIVFDVPQADPMIMQTALTNSSEKYTPRILNTIIAQDDKTISLIVLKYYYYEGDEKIEAPTYLDAVNSGKNDSESYCIETRDVYSNERLSSETLFEQKLNGPAKLIYASPNGELLFGTSADLGDVRKTTPCAGAWFWYVKRDERWERVPIDFQLPDDSVVYRYEIIKERASIVFLTFAVKLNKIYLSKYNTKTYSIEKTTELPGADDYAPNCAKLRATNGGKHLLIYQGSPEMDTKTIKCMIVSTQDMSIVKELTINDPRTFRLGSVATWDDPMILSPDLRYVAIGGRNVYLHDVERNTTTKLNSFYRRAWRHTLFNNPRSVSYLILGNNSYGPTNKACVCSLGFTADSKTLVGTNCLGDIMRWDTDKKEGTSRTIWVK